MAHHYLERLMSAAQITDQDTAADRLTRADWSTVCELANAGGYCWRKN